MSFDHIYLIIFVFITNNCIRFMFMYPFLQTTCKLYYSILHDVSHTGPLTRSVHHWYPSFLSLRQKYAHKFCVLLYKTAHWSLQWYVIHVRPLNKRSIIVTVLQAPPPWGYNQTRSSHKHTIHRQKRPQRLFNVIHYEEHRLIIIF